ncbi:MAG: type II secretion system F family protein [Candidatus Eisenbacteria bacterium]|uniref:Type II secretion system F family protein n=1 Tax=Eiseniibacteriota bacterium TaxID=2212470 RepID=A0A7Y2E6M0_UNCEI|nr:type II secretion system F family protein [Candidatus Eisenbacteria bacterium]
MAQYLFQVRNPHGEAIKGTMEAGSVAEVLTRLRDRRQIPIKVIKHTPKPSLLRSIGLKLATSDRAKANLCFNLASMVGAGLSLHETLEILAARTSNPILRKILNKIQEDIHNGNTLTEAFSQYKAAFGSVFLNILHAGEDSGELDIILQRYGEQLEDNAEINSEFQTTMIYPAALLVMGIGVSVFLVGFTLPKFVEHLTRLGAEIPKVTMALMGISNFLRGNWILLAGLLLGALIAFGLTLRTKRGRWVYSYAALKIPVVGGLLRSKAAGSFARTLSLLHESGVPLLSALDLTAKTIGNRCLRDDILMTRERVENGSTLHDAMKHCRFFSGEVTRVVSVGERTGRLGDMLEKLGKGYEKEVRRTQKRILLLMEPFLMLVLGGMVGFIALSLIVPLVRATKSLAG